MPQSHAASSTAQASSARSSRDRLPTVAAPYPRVGSASGAWAADGARPAGGAWPADGAGSVGDMLSCPGVLRDALGLHLHARARRGGRHVGPASDVGGHDEVLVQVVDVLDEPALARGADGDE